MNHASSIPLALQWTWAAVGILAFVGGVLFTILVTWPFIRESRAAIKESRDLNRKLVSIAVAVEKELENKGGARDLAAALRSIPGHLQDLKSALNRKFMDEL